MVDLIRHITQKGNKLIIMKEYERFLILEKVCEKLTKMDHRISPEERHVIMMIDAPIISEIPTQEELQE